MDTSSLRTLLNTPRPALLGPGSRPGTLSESRLREAVSQGLEGQGLSADRRELILALVLLWHDHLEASHAISQGIETRDGSFVHALMHRREPDYANAKYWWRCVGQHPAFAEIGARAGDKCQVAGGEDLTELVAPNGVWNPVAFTDCCERVEGRSPDHAEVQLLCALQRLEFEVLLERWLAP